MGGGDLDTARPTSERFHLVLSTQRDRNGLRHAHRPGNRPSFGPRQRPSWVIATLTTHHYLDIFAKEAGMEAKPVGGDVEPAVEKEVSLEGTGAH